MLHIVQFTIKQCMFPYMLGLLADCLYQLIANDLDIKSNSNESVYTRTRTNGRLSLYRIFSERQICFGIDLSV